MTPTRTARHPRRVRWLVAVLAGLAVLTVAWIVVTGLLARSQLTQARAELTGLRAQLVAGDPDLARVTATAFAGHARRAHTLTTGPAWAAAAFLPGVGAPARTVRGLTSQTAVLADLTVPGLVAVATDVDPRRVVSDGDTVDIPTLQRAAPAVHAAAAAVRLASTKVGALPTSTWLPFVDSARRTVAGQLSGLSSTLTTTDQALQVLPTMLGPGGTTARYFVGLQNEAELRGTGGLPGAFAIAAVTNGKITLERFEPDNAIDGSSAAGVDFGAAYAYQYGGDLPYAQYVDSNVSPHFPYAAQIWVAMWKAHTGETLAGAIAVDPTALSYLLAVTGGGTTAPDGAAVTAANLVSLSQRDVYAKFPAAAENEQRKQYLLGVARAVETQVLSGHGSAPELLAAVARGVGERRILAWSADPATERILAAATIGGAVQQTTQPYSQVAINNGSGGKLDYYLERAVDWTRSGCGDIRQVTVTIRLRNGAPATGLPPYVTDRFDDPGYPTVPGQNRPVVDYLATDGAQLAGVTVDGQASGAGVYDDLGHPTFRVALELRPGQTRTIVLHLVEPAGTLPVTVVRQPGVQPIAVTVADRSCRS